VTTVEDFCGVMQEVDARETDAGTAYSINKWTCPSCGRACSNIVIDDEWCHGDSLCISFIDGVRHIRCSACWLEARCAHAWKVTSQRLQGMWCRCDLCGARKEETWD
jgi:hypothetical protein